MIGAGAGAVSRAAQARRAAPACLLLKGISTLPLLRNHRKITASICPHSPRRPLQHYLARGLLRHPTARVTSHRPHRAGAGAECSPGSIPGAGAAAGAQSPKMKGCSPGPAPLQQQPLGWPGDCGGCGQLPNPSSAPWGAAAFDKASQPSRAWLVDLITVFYCAVKACWFLGEMPCGVRQSARTPLLGLAALPGGLLRGDAAGDAARPPPVPRHHGERASPIPRTHVRLLFKIQGAEKILLCASCFRDAVGFSPCLLCPVLAACAWLVSFFWSWVNPTRRVWKL